MPDRTLITSFDVFQRPFIFTCGEAHRSICPNWPFPPFINPIEAFRCQKDMAIWVTEVTEFDSGVICNLRGCLELTMASEATKIAVKGNMHTYIRVCDVKFDF